MNNFAAISLFASVVAASGLTGLVTSRMTAHWLQVEKREIDIASMYGLIVPMVVAFIIWVPVTVRPSEINAGGLYLAILASLSVFVIGSSVAFVIIVASLLMQLHITICATIDRMFAKRN